MIVTEQGGYRQEPGESVSDFVRAMLAHRGGFSAAEIAAVRRVVGPALAKPAQAPSRRPEAA